MANVALSFVVVVWISGMLFGQLTEAKQLTILKGISNFSFLLNHLWYIYAFFTYAQVKYPLGFPLIMRNILISFKGSSIFIKWYIYIYIYTYIYVQDHVVELTPPHIQNVWGLREKMFKLQESGKICSSCWISSIL